MSVQQQESPSFRLHEGLSSLVDRWEEHFLDKLPEKLCCDPTVGLAVPIKRIPEISELRWEFCERKDEKGKQMCAFSRDREEKSEVERKLLDWLHSITLGLGNDDEGARFLLLHHCLVEVEDECRIVTVCPKQLLQLIKVLGDCLRGAGGNSLGFEMSALGEFDNLRMAFAE